MENYFDALKGVATHRPGELCIVAGGAEIAVLRSSAAIRVLGPAELVELAPDEALSPAVLKKPRVLVLEVDSANPASIQRIRAVRKEYPELKIIAAIAHADVALVKTLIRYGINDVTELPFAPDELASQVLDLCSLELEEHHEVVLAPVIAVIGSMGGSGATSLLTHLAAELAALTGSERGVCLVDLNLQSGDVAAFSGVNPHVSAGTLIEAGSRLDDELVLNTAIETRYGYSIIAAPEAIMPLELMGPSQVSAILSALRSRFRFVLVDLPASLSNWSLGVVAEAQHKLIVVDSSIASLRHARRRIDLLETVGVDRGTIKVVANRTERRLFRTVGAEDISLALNSEVVASLAEAGGDLRGAQDQGVLLSETAGRTPYVKAVKDLASRLFGGSS